MDNAKTFLGFDVGATKTAWGVFTEEGRLLKDGRFPTPRQYEEFIETAAGVAGRYPDVAAIGLGIPGTTLPDRQSVLICTNTPQLNEKPLAVDLTEKTGLPTIIDNDARCALIGEVWKGGADQYENVVLITVGSGIGGAVMQGGVIQPHPQDISQEISRIIADPTDVSPARTGAGSVEGLIGGFNLEQRLSISLGELSQSAKQGDPAALQTWKQISYYFIQSIQAIYNQFHCRIILVGGAGRQDLELYLQDPAPCEVIPTSLGEQSALFGAARLAMDHFEDIENPEWE
ncbi:ROK family protein [Patescibacteria group bacterium]|nr:ROK family protein [Patescibacteria group bacterium]